MQTLTDAINTLKKTIIGKVITPGDPDYDDVSAILIKKGSPAVVVRAANNQDVAAAVTFAKENNLVLSVRTGGHSNAGHSTNDGGLVIDMRDIKSVEVIDTAKHIVRIGGGALWVDVAHALESHGLAISSGDTKTVGVGGLALAGGVGWMVRKLGLTLDHVQAVELITAEGEVVRASATENAELFWGLRGGGGNFGVATSFDIQAHPCGDIYKGTITYGYEAIEHIITGWRDTMRSAPEELTTMLVTVPSNPAFGNMPDAIHIMFCYAGDDESAASRAIAPLLALGEPVQHTLQRAPYADMLEDAHAPHGIRIVVKNAFFNELSEDVIAAIIANKSHIMQIRSVGGAMNRVASDATAFAHRASEALIVAPVFLPPNATDADVAAALEPWHRLASHSNGAYVSFFSESTPEEIHTAYPAETYSRLAALKKQYDPGNLFSQNFNIPPEA